MAETVVSFGVEKLLDFLSRESERLWGVSEQVAGLELQLRRLQSLLKDAYAKKHDSKRLRNFLEDVKDIVYDAEDIIESFVLNDFGGEEEGIKKHLRRLACFFLPCCLVDRREFASDIEGITKRISEVNGAMQSSGIQQIMDGGRSLSLKDRERVQREIRQTFPNSSESNLVGVEQSIEELVSHLVEDDNVPLVSITGMGGIGKTTLARQVFHHDIVRRHFDGFAWVCISQQFTRKDVWQRLLQELRPQDKGILHMDEYTLQGELFELLQTGRYLLVLDDVWKEDHWDRIKAVFPQKKGWKMLLTSRDEGVGLHADPTCFVFRPRILTSEESWKLCEKIVFPRRNETELRVYEEMEAIGMEMVTYCGGLPLAVKVLGGLLAKKHTISEWKRVNDNIGTQVIGKYGLDDNNLNSVYRVLSLSYEDLPMQLKHCFLYLAHFPEDHMINVETLSNYWAAEEIITSFYDGSTIRDSGEDYLDELARRNMVIAERSSLTSRIKYCKMHDMMREVCLSKAKEENFVDVVVKAPTPTSTINAQSPSRSRRLAVHSGNASQILGRTSYQKVRSLLFLKLKEEEEFRIQSAGGLGSLPMLRVLDISWVQFEGGKLPSSIGQLIHLRFLSLAYARVTHLPSSLRNLKRLLYLNLFVDAEERVHVPNVLKEMLELRYLQLPSSMDDKTKLELGDLVKLETLWYFSTEHSSVTLVGDGRDATILTSISAVQNLRFGYAWVGGNWFMIQDIGIGTQGQGVDLRMSSDFSVIYHCRIEVYQDTLLEERNIEEEFRIQSAGGLGSLPMLRVLDISWVQFEGGKLPSSIGQLIHLRFLSLAYAGVTHLPSSLRNLKLLLYLNLFVDASVHVPNVLKEMLELRYLRLPSSKDDKTKLELGDLVKLETLFGFSTKHSSVTDLLRMTKLRNLHVSVDEGGCTYETLSSSIRELRDLEKLVLLSVSGDDGGEVVLDFIHLKELELWMRMPRLPDQHRLPPHLAHISLIEFRMEEDPMPILEKFLHLKSVDLSWGAFSGRRMVCSKGGFPQLSDLEISTQEELEEWIVEQGSMPCLCTLTIYNCKKLKELPDGLKYITSLKELRICSMKREWKEKLVAGGEDYYKVQHIPSVQFIHCDE